MQGHVRSGGGSSLLSWYGIGCSWTHHLYGMPITRATASLLFSPLSELALRKATELPTTKWAGERSSLHSQLHTHPENPWGEAPCSQPKEDECSASQSETFALWGYLSWQQTKEKWHQIVVNQGFAKIENNENNPREENSHRLYLLASIGANLYCTSKNGICYLPNLSSSRSDLASLPTHLLWECCSLGEELAS